MDNKKGEELGGKKCLGGILNVMKLRINMTLWFSKNSPLFARYMKDAPRQFAHDIPTYNLYSFIDSVCGMIEL